MNSYLIIIAVLGLVVTSCSDDKKSKTTTKEVPEKVVTDVIPEEIPVIEVPEEIPVEIEIKEGEVDENTDN